MHTQEVALVADFGKLQATPLAGVVEIAERVFVGLAASKEGGRQQISLLEIDRRADSGAVGVRRVASLPEQWAGAGLPSGGTLRLASDGALYTVLHHRGEGQHARGAVLRIDPVTGASKVVADLTPLAEIGYVPIDGVGLRSDGKFYGALGYSEEAAKTLGGGLFLLN